MQSSTKQNDLIEQRSWTPQYHFYKPNHWINDPNGLFFLNGTYHLFFQLNPDDVVWGNMHWGHATSDDLINWQHQPIALYAEPEGLGYIFSGGAIVDKNNTSGFAKNGETPIVATFTQQSKDETQVQSIAYSLDEGKSFTVYDQNPVIPNPGLKDFRDPKVTWYEKGQFWIKTVVAGQCIHIYKSNDLKTWHKLSEFGHKIGAHGGVWECPDLFPLICSDTDTERWVLIISINPGGPNGGSATQYFIGDFDGEKFVSQDEQIRWLDYGTDCYAGITWDNTPNIKHSRTYIAWMSNWQYANNTPDNTWRGAMTLLRTMYLKKAEQSYYLLTPSAVKLPQDTVRLQYCLSKEQPISVPEAYSLECDISLTQGNIALVWKNDCNEQFRLEIDADTQSVTADRTKAGFTDKGFDSVIKMPLSKHECTNLQLEIFVDECSIELFFNNGAHCITALVFPKQAFSQLHIDQSSKKESLENLKITKYTK
ncbi:glycoside hydrolase family 32 protein [Pseudoalteromonas distincta]|uniref:Glycoside hydrolase family 32 protein n=1 Tax=Pseudoalteromonas distincta TaxID=77608 RepID=A0ABT9GIX5_9GAMM|nr:MULTISPECIES: glycoside hydrolase family 32 protein [Pseudoalteromonas distincta group]MDP4485842.1 glycoside hydrolase family 32 protein [Pseudoalteromonas elyakovii]